MCIPRQSAWPTLCSEVYRSRQPTMTENEKKGSAIVCLWSPFLRHQPNRSLTERLVVHYGRSPPISSQKKQLALISDWLTWALAVAAPHGVVETKCRQLWLFFHILLSCCAFFSPIMWSSVFYIKQNLLAALCDLFVWCKWFGLWPRFSVLQWQQGDQSALICMSCPRALCASSTCTVCMIFSICPCTHVCFG